MCHISSKARSFGLRSVKDATRYVPLFIRLFPDAEKRPRHREIFVEHYRKDKVTEAIRAFRKEYWKQIRSAIDHLSSSNGSANMIRATRRKKSPDHSARALLRERTS